LVYNIGKGECDAPENVPEWWDFDDLTKHAIYPVADRNVLCENKLSNSFGHIPSLAVFFSFCMCFLACLILHFWKLYYIFICSKDYYAFLDDEDVVVNQNNKARK